jgi:hypothetical protein
VTPVNLIIIILRSLVETVELNMILVLINVVLEFDELKNTSFACCFCQGNRGDQP